MNLPFDPFWIAEQMQMPLWQLAAIPFGTVLVLYLHSRGQAGKENGLYQRRSLVNRVCRFGLGLGGGLAAGFLALTIGTQVLSLSSAL